MFLHWSRQLEGKATLLADVFSLGISEHLLKDAYPLSEMLAELPLIYRQHVFRFVNAAVDSNVN